MLNKRILVLMFVLAFLTLLIGCLPSPAVPNQAPIITSSPVTTATVGEAYTYDVNATDPDGDTLTYSLATPAGMTINSATGLINWIPAAKGDYAVVVKVTDDGSPVESTTQSFTIKVSKPTPTPTPTKYYTITATAGSNGAINPSGTVTVEKGNDKLFTITPDGDYHIADVLVDGGSVGAVGTYNFVDVKQNHTINATFAIDTYTITANADPGGSINPSGAVTVNKGLNKLFIITPTVFYSIADVLVDSVSVGAVASYTFANVTDNHTISATFNLLGSVYNQDKGTHHDTIQEAIDEAGNPGNTILVMAGTYNERLTIDKPLYLIGAPNNESVITLDGLGTLNPNILIEISSGVSNVSVTGFTLIGSPLQTLNQPDESVVRCWGSSITIEDNIIDGYIGVLYKGSEHYLYVHSNHFIVNKCGVIIQFGGGFGVEIYDNTFTIGSTPALEAQAIYMTGLEYSTVACNTATNFNLRGLSGSNLSHMSLPLYTKRGGN